MKKYSLLVLFMLAAMIFGVTAVVSAESKTEYYNQINQTLNILENAIHAENTVEVKNQLGQLRTEVYSAARYLTLIGEYDSRLLNVISLATRATEMDSDEDISSYISRARLLAAEILLDKIPTTQGVPEAEGTIGTYEGHS